MSVSPLMSSSLMSSPVLPSLLLLLLPSLASAQSYGNMTYDKLSYLMTFHDEEFDVDTSDLNNDYIKAVIELPILVTVLLFLGMVIFELSLVFRCCCKCLRCMSHGEAPERDSMASVAAWTGNVSKSKTSLTRFFYFFFFLSCAFCHGIIWSMQYFENGSDDAIGATSDLKDTAISLENSGIALDTQGDVILNLTALAIPTCSEAAAVATYAEDFETYMADYLDIVGPLPDNLQDLEDFLNDWRVGDADMSGAVFNVYIMFIAMTFPMLISFCLKNKCTMRCSLCCGLLYIHVLLVVFCLYFIALSIMGDFCEAPTDNLISITPDSVVDEATYFGTCNGTNPFSEPVSQAYDAVQSLESSIITLTEVGGNCENNTYLLACLPVVTEMYTEIDSIEVQMSCGPLQQFWGDIVNEATCTNIYTALFILFWTVLLVLLSYFCLLIVSSLIYQYFGDLWHAEDQLKFLEGVHNSSSLTTSGELNAEMSNRTSETQLAWQRNSEDDVVKYQI